MKATTEPLRGVAGCRAMGVVLFGMGVVALAATTQIPSVRDGWSVSGPRFVPLVASIATMALATGFLARTASRPDVELFRAAAAESAATHWPSPLAVMTALVGYALVMAPIGFAAATAAFIAVTSRVLGSEHTRRDAVVGVALGVVTSYAFTRWLGVRLPIGPWGV